MDSKTKVRIKEPHDRIDDVNDQNNIREINTRNEIASLKAWIEQVSKSEALHAERVIALTMDVTTLKSKVKTLEDCEDLRDQQLTVLKTFIEKYLTVEINQIKGDHDGKIGVLSIPKAKK